MPTLHAEIDIDAPRFAVWDALIRKEEWYRWNTFLFDCDASRPMQQGRDILVALRRREGDAEMEFQPRVVVMQTNRCLRWMAKVPGLKSEYLFELEDVGTNRTRYRHQQRMTGAFSRVFLPFIRQDERAGMGRMTWQMKRYVEEYYRRFW